MKIKKIKSLSPLITIILLIVVVFALISIIISWGKNFTNMNLNNTNSNKLNSDTPYFVTISKMVVTKYIDGGHTSNYVIIDNKSNYSTTIKGYEIFTDSNNLNFLNELYFDVNNIDINANLSIKFNIYCIPKNDYTLKLFTTNNKVISIDSRGSGNIGSCNVKFPGNRYLDLDDFNYDVNNFIIIFEFSAAKPVTTDYGTLFAYRYRGAKNRSAPQRSGIKFYYPNFNVISITGSQHGGSYWWGYNNYILGVAQDYNIIYIKNGRNITGCIYNNSWSQVNCTNSWYYPYYDINTIYYNTDKNYKTTIGAAYTGNGYNNYFNGDIKRVVFAPLTTDNNYDVRHALPISDYYINYNLLTGDYYKK